jgi:hypothetical protein
MVIGHCDDAGLIISGTRLIINYYYVDVVSDLIENWFERYYYIAV